VLIFDQFIGQPPWPSTLASISFHEADGFSQGHHNPLIMVKVFKGAGPAFAVLEPFVAELITHDGKGPYIGRDTWASLIFRPKLMKQKCAYI
jgi:hypothetical protein